MRGLSGRTVEIDLKSSIGLGRVDGNRLYGPGRSVVPVELADAVGAAYDKGEVQGAPAASSEGDGGLGVGGSAAGAPDDVKEYDTAFGKIAAGPATEGFPTTHGEVNDLTVPKLEDEIEARGINLPDGKGSGANGAYVKEDLVQILCATC